MTEIASQDSFLGSMRTPAHRLSQTNTHKHASVDIIILVITTFMCPLIQEFTAEEKSQKIHKMTLIHCQEDVLYILNSNAFLHV